MCAQLDSLPMSHNPTSFSSQKKILYTYWVITFSHSVLLASVFVTMKLNVSSATCQSVLLTQNTRSPSTRPLLCHRREWNLLPKGSIFLLSFYFYLSSQSNWNKQITFLFNIIYFGNICLVVQSAPYLLGLAPPAYQEVIQTCPPYWKGPRWAEGSGSLYRPGGETTEGLQLQRVGKWHWLR